jgi:hypothetical protein
MRLTKRSVLAAVLVAAVVFVAAAAADHGGRGRGHHGPLLEQRLIGSILSDQPIHGATRGSVPWVGKGTATLDRRGRFEVRIRGLVIAGTNNPGPVTTVTVSLYCAPDSSAAVFTTTPVSLSSHGDARIRQHVTVPSRCLAPVVLVHPNGAAAAYIMATGFAK